MTENKGVADKEETKREDRDEKEQWKSGRESMSREREISGSGSN